MSGSVFAHPLALALAFAATVAGFVIGGAAVYGGSLVDALARLTEGERANERSWL